MIRKIKFFALITVFLLLMAGCDLDKKIGESITEGILEKAVGDDVDIEMDGEDFSLTTDEGDISFDEEEGMTFEGEDGSVMASGGVYEWPSDQAAEYLPKFDGGKITYILNSKESCMLMIEETEMEDYEDYVKAVIDKGYTENKMESSAEDMVLYSATSVEGITATVYYSKSIATLTISVDASGISNE